VLDHIDHVVLVMLENRSFDTIVGWLYKDDQPSKFVGADTKSPYNGLQTGSYSNEYGGRTIPVTFGTTGASGHLTAPPQPLRVTASDPNEEYAHVIQQLFGSPSRPTEKNPKSGTPAAMAGFAYDYDAAWESWDQLDQIMEAYSPAQLPILNGLAKAYGVSDAWFSSVPTQTNPNRAFSLCGTSLGRTDNSSITAVEQFDTKTIWNALPAGTSWGVYYHDVWHDSKCYTEYTFPRCSDAPGGKIETIDAFYKDATAGTLPRFTYLEPKWGYGATDIVSGFWEFVGVQGNDYHPPTWVGPGEAFVNEVYEALIANADAWSRTLLIITFDEHGGTYDHVDPGWGALQPDGNYGDDGFAFDRYGVRVPTLLISPWVSAGTVFRSPSTKLKFDHTSIIATILEWCGVDPTAAGLGDRVAKAPTFDGALADVVRSDVPRFTVPDGHAEQGQEYWTADADIAQLGPGLVRSLVARSRSADELRQKIKTALDQQH
jgi:phospholipase C